MSFKRHFSWHALLLTFVRVFEVENYPKAGGCPSQAHLISVRKLSDFNLKFNE